jgi:murein DD-endopeptidase MepM/ murein hydrolase activator NlpD
MSKCRVLVLLLLLALTAAPPAPQSAAQSPPPGPTSCPALQRLPQADEDEIRRQAEALLTTYRAELFGGWDIVAISGLGDWGVVSIAPRTWKEEPLSGDGDILLAHREQGAWRVVLPDTAQFNAWLPDVPTELLVPSPERGRYAISAVPAAPSTGVYRLPYECGHTALASRAGPYHDNAIDFIIGVVSGGGDVVVAAQAGWVYRVGQDNTACCCSSGYSSNSVILQHANGEYSYYLHLAAGSVTVQVGDAVYQGQLIAREGDVGYTCSSAGGLCHSRFCDVPGTSDYCCEHLHFEVRDNGIYQGVRLEPRFADVPGEFVQTGQYYTSGNCCSETLPPTTTHAFAGIPGENGWYVSPVQVTLTAQDAGGSGVRATYYQLDGGGWLTYTATFTIDSEGEHTLVYYSVDNCGNQETPSLPIHLDVDLYDPFNPTAVRSGCDAANNAWQNLCDDPAFAWAGAGDGRGSGVRDYPLYWGLLSAGQPLTYTVPPAYDPGPVPEGQPCFLRLATRDQAGRQAPTATLFVLRYDATPPTITSFLVAGGVSTTQQVTVRLDVAADDSASGPAEMRFSNNGTDWSAWQPFATQSTWALPGLDGRTYIVYAQVRDRAGNIAAASDDILLDLSPPSPHAASFRLCADVMDIGGAGPLTATHYTLLAAVGQPWGSGAGSGGSAGFGERAGFLANITSCQPLSWTVSPVTIAQWVVASGGSGRSSGTFRLADTAGEAAASGVFSSASYRLGSGFWAPITGTVPLPPSLPTPPPIVPPTPAPTPVPSPRPVDFGLAINGGYSFTNQVEVTLTLDGPGATQMRVRNDRFFDGQLWETYRLTRTWAISTAGPYQEPRFVYAQFRDAMGIVYGDYLDSIVYDPVSPTGQVGIIAQGSITVTLWLTATDDNSGVGWMRLAGDAAGLGTAPWVAFAPTAVFTLTEVWVYAQFRDRAGNVSVPASTGLAHRVYLPLVAR